MNNKKSSGQVPPNILILIGGVIVVIAVVIVIFFITSKKAPPPPAEPQPKGPVTELEVKNIRVKLVKAEDIGNTLFGADNRYHSKENVTTTGKFIRIIVSAENTGKEETKTGDWDIGEIIDGEGRKFSYFSKQDVWLPIGNECKKTLKPGFEPLSCTKIYEVAKVSKDMKVRVIFNAVSSGKNFIDLIGI